MLTDGSPRSEPASMCTIWGLPSPAPPRFLVGNNFRGLQVSPAPAAAGVTEEDVAQDLPRATTPHAAAARCGQPAGRSAGVTSREHQAAGPDIIGKLPTARFNFSVTWSTSCKALVPSPGLSLQQKPPAQ
ncbi:uncharacterized protein LOC119388676 [Rhipicephalus sanguineus]|uniref:uncharacterized protein LOC119388676 n=1 Tax=Rhipicephalus sanguineus TaxID=34632 RepID=UPI0018934337|nr:uncharacterized protein LOC119388676 [Rhipicephalus sanguineus]